MNSSDCCRKLLPLRRVVHFLTNKLGLTLSAHMLLNFISNPAGETGKHHHPSRDRMVVWTFPPILIFLLLHSLKAFLKFFFPPSCSFVPLQSHSSSHLSLCRFRFQTSNFTGVLNNRILQCIQKPLRWFCTCYSLNPCELSLVSKR